MNRNNKIAELNRLLPKIRETLKKEISLKQIEDVLPLTVEFEERIDVLKDCHSVFKKALSDLKSDIESDIRLYSYILRAISYGTPLHLTVEEVQEEFLIEYIYLLSFINSGGQGPRIYLNDLFEDCYCFTALIIKERGDHFAEKILKLYSQTLYGDLRNEFFEIFFSFEK